MSPDRWICDSCGYDGLRASFTGTIEFSVMLGCPVCGMSMRRDDALGEIEAELILPVSLRAATKGATDAETGQQ